MDPDGVGPEPEIVTHTVYDGDHAWADYAADGTLRTRYLYGDQIDQIVARWTPTGGTNWYLGDRQGSIVAIADASGSVIHTVTYSSFGQIVGQTNPTNGDRFKYTGRELDAETGNYYYYYRARYYDASNGRFLSEDSYGFSAGDTNLYRYGGNSPTNGTDPTGHV